MQRTFSIVKPDATKRGLAGQIIARIEEHGFNIIAQKKIRLTQEQAERFYGVHKDRPFFNSLVEFMVSGPVIVQVLEKEDAVASYRKLMGATNPQEAEAGTIRADFAQSIEANSVHGSDSDENAEIEIAFFFSGIELLDT